MSINPGAVNPNTPTGVVYDIVENCRISDPRLKCRIGATYQDTVVWYVVDDVVVARALKLQ